MKIEILEAGYCTHPEAVVNPGQGLKPQKFSSTVVVIDHPKQGLILFDTGYSKHFLEATSTWPEKLYAMTTPVHLENGRSAVEQLEKKGIRSKDVGTIILSHFHADHVSGIKDFPNAKYICIGEAFENLCELVLFDRLRSGFLKTLFPSDFKNRSQFLGLKSFSLNSEILNGQFEVFDLFADESVYLVSLPGHAAGHIGLFLNHLAEPLFFIGDAAWRLAALANNALPSVITGLVIQNWKFYGETFHKLHHLHKSGLQIIPCHCEQHQLDLISQKISTNNP